MCKRAKILTKEWRLIVPKPTVEEVKRSLETSGIRVVNDRPGRQARKKDSGRNQKELPPTTTPKREVTSVTQQVRSTSLSSFSPIPRHSIATATVGPRIDSVTSITGGKGIPSKSTVQANSLIKAPMKPPGSDRQISPISLQQNNDNPPIVTPVTNLIETDSQMQNQIEEQFVDPAPGRLVDPDLGDQNIEKTHAMLESHYSNLTSEIKEIKMLMNFYRDKRNQQRLLREQQYQERKDKNEIDLQNSGQNDPDIRMQAPDPPIQSYEYCQDHKIEETSPPEEILKLCLPVHNTEDNDSITEYDSITETMELEEWTF